jgi:hypothetical protein
MPVIINGSTGISGTDGSAATPAVQGTDTNTGMFFPAADTIAFAEGGTEVMRINSSGQVEYTLGTASLPSITATGDTNTGIYFPGADRIGFAEGGAQVGEFDASGNFLFNSGYGSVARAFGCRAWVNFNGTGTVAIQASGNVTSITDNNVGDYTVNFTNAMPAANYATVGTARSSGVANGVCLGTIVVLTGSVRVGTTSGASNSSVDTNEVCVAIFR